MLSSQQKEKIEKQNKYLTVPLDLSVFIKVYFSPKKILSDYVWQAPIDFYGKKVEMRLIYIKHIRSPTKFLTQQ